MTLSDYLTEQGAKSLKTYKEKRLIGKRVNQNFSSQFVKFQNTYRDNLVAFAADCIEWDNGEGLTFYQNDILEDFQTYDRQAVRGPRTLGKTALGSISLLGWGLTYEGHDWKVGTTASVWRQLELYLWPEIHKWGKKIKWDKIGRDPLDTRLELMTMKLRLTTGTASAVASDNHETLEGMHADFLYYIFDEAKIIPIETWDAIEGAFAGSGEGGAQIAKVLAISTPGEPAGRFYDIHKHAPGFEDWHTVHITPDMAIRSGRLSQSWVDQRRAQWGENSALFKNQVLGEFAAHHEDVIIPLSWVDQANSRNDKWVGHLANGGDKGIVTSIGLDIALGGTGNDKPMFALVYNETQVEILEFQPKSNETALMEIAGRAKGLLDRYNVNMFIDVNGLGVGVYNRLKEMKISHAIPFNNSSKPPPRLKDKSGEFKFRNKRAAMWLLGKDLLSPDENSEICLPRDNELIGELTRTRSKPLLSEGVIQVESKDDIRKRIGRSTDKADAVLMALLGPRLSSPKRARVYVAGRGYIHVPS